MGGALCVASEALAAELKADRTALGSQPGNLEVWAQCPHFLPMSRVPAK